jgi:hypothetical protein
MDASFPEGLRFGCTGCGDCCRQPGSVYFDWKTLRRMARHLGMSASQFRNAFDVRWDPEHGVHFLDAEDGSGCPLLDGDRCRVHPVKPEQCRAFPFWPEIVASPAAWAEAARSCPGIDHPDGEWFSWEAVRDRARRVSP